jgi:hypothetical protein
MLKTLFTTGYNDAGRSSCGILMQLLKQTEKYPKQPLKKPVM